MTDAELDVEYHEHFDKTNVDGWAPKCRHESGDLWVSPCQRPPGHDGSHASILGMDPDVNDWERWTA